MNSFTDLPLKNINMMPSHYEGAKNISAITEFTLGIFSRTILSYIVPFFKA
jgi:hypothetical protein